MCSVVECSEGVVVVCWGVVWRSGGVVVVVVENATKPSRFGHF